MCCVAGRSMWLRSPLVPKSQMWGVSKFFDLGEGACHLACDGPPSWLLFVNTPSLSIHLFVHVSVLKIRLKIAILLWLSFTSACHYWHNWRCSLLSMRHEKEIACTCQSELVSTHLFMLRWRLVLWLSLHSSFDQTGVVVWYHIPLMLMKKGHCVLIKVPVCVCCSCTKCYARVGLCGHRRRARKTRQKTL